MNRIHQPLIIKLKKTPSINNFKKNIILNSSDIDNEHNYSLPNTDNSGLLENIEEFKVKMEEDILELKQKIEVINDIHSNEDSTQALQLVNTLNSHLEDYKKITNERIEKLVKLFLIINDKISNLKTD